MERDKILDAVVDEIKRRGGTVDGIRPAKGGHRMLYWTTAKGTKIALTVQAYAGGARSLRNGIANVRRASP